MQPQIAGTSAYSSSSSSLGSCSSTGPVFWSYAYDSSSTAPAAAAAAAAAAGEQQQQTATEVDTNELNKLVAAAMYQSIKESMPYILQTQYNCTAESCPWLQQQTSAAEQQVEKETKRIKERKGLIAFEGIRKETSKQRQRRGCC